MKVRTFLLLCVIAGVLLFTAVNWSLMTAPFELNLIVTTWEFPLGITLLAVIGLISLLFLVFLAWIEGAALLEDRNRGKELERSRKIAENAEASRLRALTDTVLQEFNELHVKLDLFLDRQERSSSVAGGGAVQTPDPETGLNVGGPTPQETGGPTRSAL